jgi:hypothetical protein
MLAGTCRLAAVGARGKRLDAGLVPPRAEPARTTLEGLIAVAQALEANTVASVLS